MCSFHGSLPLKACQKASLSPAPVSACYRSRGKNILFTYLLSGSNILNVILQDRESITLGERLKTR